MRQIPDQWHHSLSRVRSSDRGRPAAKYHSLWYLLRAFFSKPRDRSGSFLQAPGAVFALLTSQQPTRCLVFTWNKISLHLGFRSLTPAGWEPSPHPRFEPSFCTLGAGIRGLWFACQRASVQFSSVQSVLRRLPDPSCPSMLPPFCFFVFYCSASEPRRCCMVCRSEQRPCCKASPPPGSPWDAGWRHPLQTPRGWPSGNSGSCSLSTLQRRDDTTSESICWDITRFQKLNFKISKIFRFESSFTCTGSCH